MNLQTMRRLFEELSVELSEEIVLQKEACKAHIDEENYGALADSIDRVDALRGFMKNIGEQEDAIRAFIDRAPAVPEHVERARRQYRHITSETTEDTCAQGAAIVVQRTQRRTPNAVFVPVLLCVLDKAGGSMVPMEAADEVYCVMSPFLTVEDNRKVPSHDVHYKYWRSALRNAAQSCRDSKLLRPHTGVPEWRLSAEGAEFAAKLDLHKVLDFIRERRPEVLVRVWLDARNEAKQSKRSLGDVYMYLLNNPLFTDKI